MPTRSFVPLALVAASAVLCAPAWFPDWVANAQCERFTTTTGGSGGVVKLLASDPASSAALGTSVALSTDTMIAGAPAALTNNSSPTGEAYIYVYSGGFWTQQARLGGPPRQASNFGSAVAFAGGNNTVLIGEPAAGMAYVSNRSGTTWSAPAALTRTESLSGDRFGASIATGSLGIRNTAAIGAPGYAGSVSDGGAAFVMTLNTTAVGGWVESGFVTASDRATGDEFGTSVGISGNTMVVGAPQNSNTGGSHAGAAYVFVSNSFASGWTQQAKLAPNDPQGGALFGSSVAILGDTIIVGAPRHLDGTDANGRVYVFTRSGTVWTQHNELTSGITGGFFGSSVSISGDRLVGGGTYGTVAGHAVGTGYIALCSRPPGSGTAGTWMLEDVFAPSDAAHNDSFGMAVSILGTRVAAGDPEADQGAANAGAAYIVSIANPCPADYNCSGTLNVQDIFDFLAGWFAGDARADFNATGGITVQDIFDFLAAWFAGCP